MSTLSQTRATIADMLQKLEGLPQTLDSSTPANSEAVESGIIPAEFAHTGTIVVWENTAIWPQADYDRYEGAWVTAVNALHLTSNKGFPLGLSVPKGAARARDMLNKLDVAIAANALPTRLETTVIDVLPPPAQGLPTWAWVAIGAGVLGVAGLLTAAYVKAGKKNQRLSARSSALAPA